jgi:hypothetical protein
MPEARRHEPPHGRMAQRLLRRGRSGDHETAGGSTSENAVKAKFRELFFHAIR